MSEQDIVTAVQATLEHNRDINPHHYPISVHLNGVLQPSGVVGSDEASRVAEADCWYVPEVRAVGNHLEVRPPNV